MSSWSKYVELREEEGKVRAFRTGYTTLGKREIQIPNWPRDGVNIREWLDFLSLYELEAFRQFYLDKWTWETGDAEQARMISLVKNTIDQAVPGHPDSPLQQGRTTFDLKHIRQMSHRRYGEL